MNGPMTLLDTNIYDWNHERPERLVCHLTEFRIETYFCQIWNLPGRYTKDITVYLFACRDNLWIIQKLQLHFGLVQQHTSVQCSIGST